jgi:hypothetical protein
MMVLLTVLAIGLLTLASIELRKTGHGEARSVALANARLGLVMALGQLQADLGDDRRITADGSVLTGTNQPSAVGVWNSWTPGLAERSGAANTPRINYSVPKGQNGFRNWLVSSGDPEKTRQLAWHREQSSGSEFALLFSRQGSGFDLGGEKITVGSGLLDGGFAWAVTQENTKARINVGSDESKLVVAEGEVRTPARPSLELASGINHPSDGDWSRRSALVSSLSQAALDPEYGLPREGARPLSGDFTVDSYSLLTDVVRGGVKVDLSTGLDLPDQEFAAASWADQAGTVTNPFRGTLPREYRGEKPLFQPLINNAQLRVFMDFHPASVNHKFNVNGVATFDKLRAHYRGFRHLYQSTGGELTAFERPYSHIAIPDRVAGRPFGLKTHASVSPVLNRLNFLISIYAKNDGTLCILFTPYVTLWNPHNVAIETEGVVIYPWIDLALFWNWSVTPQNGSTMNWSSSLSRFVGEGFQGHGRSSRPYFYLHLTETGDSVRSGTRNVSPPIKLAPGEVRVFCLADNTRRDLEIFGGAAQRTWRMKPADSAQDIARARTGGIALNMRKSINGGNNFNYQLKPGDRVNAHRAEFDRGTYYYIIGMADAHQIKNPNSELMVEARAAGNGLPTLPAEPNLVFYNQIHSGRAFGKGNDVLNYPSFTFDEIRERPVLVGSLLTYHRTARAGGGALSHSDLNFTTNPRQAFVNPYLSGARFQSGPHYESLLQSGTSLAQLAMETSGDGRHAYYGPSHSAATGKTHLAFFEIPRSPVLSLGALQHCDLSATPFGVPNQIGNSWASPYVPSAAVSRRATQGPNNTSLNPGLGVYDVSYLANEALFDGFFFSGATPEFGAPKSATGTPSIWMDDQIDERKSVTEVIERFFSDPVNQPLRNPRMKPYRGTASNEELAQRLGGPARAARLGAHLMIEGGFNINSTSEEAWAAVLASLRGIEPASSDRTAQSRFMQINTGLPLLMKENDPWSGFRSLTDAQIRQLAKAIVAEVRLRGPFLSLGEFVNRRVSGERQFNLAGALQSAIDKSALNTGANYSSFNTTNYPEPANIPNPNTGTNTPGWLTQADLLHGLAPTITPRSDTFVVRSYGEARAANGDLLASVRLEATVQRVPDWVDPNDDPAAGIAQLKSPVNSRFGRRFEVVSLREITLDSAVDPL